MLCAVGTTPGASAKRALIGRALTNLRDRPLKQLATWAAAGAVVLSAPFGGWADAAKPPLPVLEVDTVITTGPLDVTLHRVTASTRPGEKFNESKNGQYLLVFGTVKNSGKETLSNLELRDVVRLQGVDGLERHPTGGAWLSADEAERATPTVYNAADSTTMATVVPELSYEVAWVFERRGEAAPSSVNVEVRGFTYRQRTLDDYTGWLDPTDLGHLRMPVTVKAPYEKPAT
jgi:hypothetical protein